MDEVESQDVTPSFQNAAEEGKELVDINTASLRKLITLPGVGRALARRIIDQRPYRSLDDFKQRCRIKERLWKELESYCMVTPAEGSETASEIKEEETVLGNSEHAPPDQEEKIAERPVDQVVSIVPFAEVPPKSEKPREKTPKDQPISKTYVWWVAASLGAFVLLLSVLLNFAVLAAVNHGWRYVSPSDLMVVQREMETAKEQMQGVRGELGALHERLDALQGISGRIDTLESAQKELKDQLVKSIDDVQKAQDKVDDLGRRIDQLADQVDEARKQAGRFEGFFTGLKELLDTIQP